MVKRANVNLLSDYAQFLESVLNDFGYEVAEHDLLEITDNNFNVVSDYLGFSSKSGKRNAKSLRTGTVDILDKFLIDSNYMPSVDVVYSQLPFSNPDGMIRKLALVPDKTPAVAIFGSYSSEVEKYEPKRIQECLQQFASALDDFEYLSKKTDEGNLELVISVPKIKTYTKVL